MTYQDLIKNIRDLGFSDDAEIDDFGELIFNGINRAITEINYEVAPIIERYEFDITEDDTGFLYIEMPDVDDNYMSLTDTPVQIQKGDTEMYVRFNDFEIEAQDTIIIDQDNISGTFRIFYKAAHTPYDGSQLLEELPLPKKVHHLVQLLASYYIWLEDEPVKAAQYYNLYEQKKADFTVDAKPRMRVLPGGI